MNTEFHWRTVGPVEVASGIPMEFHWRNIAPLATQENTFEGEKGAENREKNRDET